MSHCRSGCDIADAFVAGYAEDATAVLPGSYLPNKEAIRATMLLTAGNLSAAARILGVSRPTLTRRLRESGLTRRSLLASS